MAYIPPMLRENTQQISVNEALDVSGETMKPLREVPVVSTLPMPNTHPTFLHADIHDYYWAPQSNDTSDDSCPTTFIAAMHHSTLNSSAADRDKLRYVMLFQDANPRWNSDGIIFVKSSLHLLPGGEKFKDDAPFFKNQVLSSSKIGDRKMVVQQKELTEDGVVEKQDPGEKQKGVDYMDEPQTAYKNEATEGKAEASKESQGNKSVPVDVFSHSGARIDHHLDDNNFDNSTEAEGGEQEESTSAIAYSPDLSQYDTGPVAVFEQAGKRRSDPFHFSGYYKIARLQYLAPQSADLFRMLEQKFSTIDRFGRVKQRQRSAASWQASMRLPWAVVKMEQDDEANSKLALPEIIIQDMERKGERKPKKTVNELLQRMRLEG